MCSATNPSSMFKAQRGLWINGFAARCDHVASCTRIDMIRTINHLLTVSFGVLLDIVRFLFLSVRSSATLRTENLFLRGQLALCAERRIKARQTDDGTRLALVLLSKLFAWKESLIVVKPGTPICWHRKGFRLFWRWKCKSRGRPWLPMEPRQLIA